MYLPSVSTQTGVTCGLPSRFTVATNAKFLPSKSFLACSSNPTFFFIKPSSPSSHIIGVFLLVYRFRVIGQSMTHRWKKLVNTNTPSQEHASWLFDTHA